MEKVFFFVFWYWPFASIVGGSLSKLTFFLVVFVGELSRFSVFFFFFFFFFFFLRGGGWGRGGGVGGAEGGVLTELGLESSVGLIVVFIYVFILTGLFLHQSSAIKVKTELLLETVSIIYFTNTIIIQENK